MILESLITCPHCGTAKTESMPTDACQFFYECSGCGAKLRPKPGDCCVFCSYGSVPCPPIQAERLGERCAANCCAQGDGIIVNDTIQASHDWLANTRASALGRMSGWTPMMFITRVRL